MSPDRDDREARGEDPDEVVGQTRPRPPEAEPDPAWQPDKEIGDEWRDLYNDISRDHRPRREDVYPYLLIRAFSPGDRGQRPIWPPTVCWESPDILLIDATWNGPFDPSRLVASPTAGRSYRVFVRVWNLGLFPAVGVHVKAWAVNPGFFGAFNEHDPYYQQQFIGGRMLEQLEDRTRPGCTAVVELDQQWHVEPGAVGHHCMLASVTCPLDQFAGPLLANDNRHVGQRNLTILAGNGNAKPLILQLSDLVPKEFTLELTHGGPAAVPLMHALSGDGRELVAPQLDEIRGGVDIGASVHLLTAFHSDGRTVSVPSDRLAEHVDRSKGEHPFAEAGGTRRLLERLGADAWYELGDVSDASVGDAFLHALAAMTETDAYSAESLAQGFGGPDGAQHLLRLTVSSPKGELVGGYSLLVSA